MMCASYPQPATELKPLHADPRQSGHTERRDDWDFENKMTILALVVFGIWATFRAFGNVYTEAGVEGYLPHILSPFFSPPLQKWFPGFFETYPFLKAIPAFLVMWVPVGFRGTCYFYRRAYYRAFFRDPAGCGVNEDPNNTHGYTGERRFPFVIQNLHRYFFYLALAFSVLHIYHVWEAMHFITPDHSQHKFGMSLGTLVMLADAILLTAYVTSCHSWRHLLAGKLDCFSCTNFNEGRHEAWKLQTWLNERHMQLAWISLATVGLADVFVYLVASGVIKDVLLFAF